MFLNLLKDLWIDLNEFKGWWQVLVVIVSVLASYFSSHFFYRRFLTDPNLTQADIIAERLFNNMRFSVLLFGFLYVGKLLLSSWQHSNLLSLLLPVIGFLALFRFGAYVFRRIFFDNGEPSGTHIWIEKVFSWSVWIIAILYYTSLLHDSWAFLEHETIAVGRNKLSIAEILQGLIWVAGTVLLALWASAVLDKRLMKIQSLNLSLRIVLSRLGRALLIILAILISLNLVGIDLTVLSIFGGALGVGLGLGLQKIASNYVSGFIILLDRSLSIHDMITVDKYSGRVTKISTRYTVLKGLDGVESIIPNEMLISNAVQNLSLTDKEVLLNTDVTVGYSTDLVKLLPMLVDVASKVPRVSKRWPPRANLISFADSGLALRVYFWISDPENGRTSLISDVNLAIWKLLQEQQVEVPFPQMEVRMLGSSGQMSDDRGQSGT